MKIDNGSPISLIVYSIIACCGIMALAWLWSDKIKNTGLVNVFWAYNFPVIAVVLYFFAPGFQTRKVLLCSMIIIAGLRLGTHLAKRFFKNPREEESRYKQLREDWEPAADKKILGFFLMQGVANVLLAIPFFIVAINTNTQMSLIEYAASLLWIAGVMGEAIADGQLSAFKKDAANQGKVCDVSLWYYSRHPNYFFEWVMWIAYFVFALASPYGYIAAISPIIILYLLIKVTGVPVTEEKCLITKGEEYKRYQASTSMFIPWFKATSN